MNNFWGKVKTTDSKLITFWVFFLLGIGLFSICFNWLVSTKKGNVLAENVSVTSAVYGCELRVKVIPEKRVANNFSNYLNIDIYNSSNQRLGTVSPLINMLNSDYFGVSDNVNVCELAGVKEMGGNFDYYITGYSHLTKKFPSQPSFYTVGTYLDLSNQGLLMAGETSNIFDNKINSLDLSTQVVHLYQNDLKNDLNRDSKVNSLDLSNTITNFYMVGDKPN